MPNLEICESEKTCLQHQHVGRTRHALTVFARYSLLSTATDGREGYALAARQGQPKRHHLLAVASQQDVADQNWVVPCLARHRLEPRELRELVGCRRDQGQFALLRQHQEQVLIR